MLKHMTMRMESGNASEQLKKKISNLIAEFESNVESRSKNLAPKVVRSKLPGSIFVFCDPEKIFLVYTPKFESRYLINDSPVVSHPDQIIREISLVFDVDDFAPAVFPRAVIDADSATRSAIVSAIADAHINQQVEVFRMKERISVFSPIFGENSYPVQSDLVFVLMPFEEDLTQIYNNIIREAIEQDCGLVCRRADEIKSINPIMKDIWKSICEARLVLADLTGFNANVMYELGISHTVGKETLLLYQDTETEKRFPFDLAHIRRINYKDTATGGKALRTEISATIRNMLQFS